jgi:predicted outer membrane protein
MTRSYLASGAALAALLLIGGCGSASRDATATTAQANGTMLASADFPRPPAIPDEATDA